MAVGQINIFEILNTLSKILLLVRLNNITGEHLVQ